MPFTTYGFTHPDLPEPIPVTIRQHAQAVVDAWPGAALVARSPAAANGIRGRRPAWTAWSPVREDTPSPAQTPEPHRAEPKTPLPAASAR
ncbi:MAG: hypothetical protein ACRDP6_32515 [Actinoallomurus sp.]